MTPKGLYLFYWQTSLLTCCLAYSHLLTILTTDRFPYIQLLDTIIVYTNMSRCQNGSLAVKKTSATVDVVNSPFHVTVSGHGNCSGHNILFILLRFTDRLTFIIYLLGDFLKTSCASNKVSSWLFMAKLGLCKRSKTNKQSKLWAKCLGWILLVVSFTVNCLSLCFIYLILPVQKLNFLPHNYTHLYCPSLAFA